MPDMILDGTGTGKLAKVDNENRLRTYSIVQSSLEHSVDEGNGYFIHTGVITLTDAAETPILYLKSNETRDLIIDSLFIGLGTSTNGTATVQATITVVKNATAGTIVSGATAVDINSNRNFGSNKALSADAYKGATGNTMTDGSDHIIMYQEDFTQIEYNLTEELTPGSSIGVKLTPPTSNTSLPCYAAIVCHLGEE